MNIRKFFTLVSIIALFLFFALSAGAVSILRVQQGGTGVGTITGIIKGNGTSPFSAATAGTDYEVPLTFGDGLTRTGDDVDVDTTQNIGVLSNLTTNGFVKTSGGTGTLSIDTNTYLTGNQTITLSGDVSGSGPTAITTTLATVNPNVGTFGSATESPALTVNGKGLITAVSNTTITPAVGSITGLGTGVATALGVNVGSAGAFVTFNGALGTPSSGTGTNITGIPAANILAGTFGTGAYVIDTSLTNPILYGSSASGGNLTLYSTSHATKGKILFGTSAYDEVNNRLGIGTASPSYAIHLSTGDFAMNSSPSGGGFFYLINGVGTNRDIAFSNSSSNDNFGQLSVYPTTGTNVASSLGVFPKGTGAFGIGGQLGIYTTDLLANSVNFERMRIAGLVGASFTIISEKAGTGTVRPIILTAGVTNQLYLAASTGNVKIAGSATRATTEGTNHLDIFDGTAPVGTLTNGTSLYSSSGELLAMNASGVASRITGCPANFTAYGLGCIQTAEEGTGTWDAAREDCFDTHRGRLPEPQELMIAFNNFALTNETDDDEWLDQINIDVGVTTVSFLNADAGTADEAADVAEQAASTVTAYRCVIPFAGAI